MNDITGIASLSILPGVTDIIRRSYGINSAQEFVEHIAKIKDCTIDEARETISHSPELLKIMFSIA